MIDRQRAIIAAALCSLLSVGASVSVADTIARPVPVVGQVSTYAITGSSSGVMTLPGSDQGIPVDLETAVKLERRVERVDADGSVTVNQVVTDHSLTLSGQDVDLGKIPAVEVTTRPDGTVVSMNVNGKAAKVSGISPAEVQALLAVWQLPTREFKVGDVWKVALPLEPGGAAVAMAQTYAGAKTVKDQRLLQVESHLSAPVQIQAGRGRKLGGFVLDSLKINSMDGSSYYSPDTGSLVNANAKVDIAINAKMGPGANAMNMTVQMPLALSIQLVKLTHGPAPGTGVAPGAAGTAGSGSAAGTGTSATPGAAPAAPAGGQSPASAPQR